MTKQYQIGAYYFPNYHADPRNEALYGKGWTEWELLKHAKPRFEGHYQPRVPMWGYEDEADPVVFAKKIDAAADHAVDYFLFDWYWYNDGPFLNRCLEEGYLNAPNRDRVQFALMWAIHNWLDIFPLKRSMSSNPRLLYPGPISLETWDIMTDHIVETYFSVPSYWKIDGCPFFSLYELALLIEGLGSVEATRTAFERFRAKTKAAGFPDLHLNAVVWGLQLLPGELLLSDPMAAVEAIGFDSVTSYVAIHHVPMETFPVTDYGHVMGEMAKYWDKAAATYRIPYFPNVTMGWDSSPRTCQSDVFDEKGYPFIPILGNGTPAAFEKALRDARDFLDRTPSARGIMNINAWNEWTEGSYLEPDTVNGMGYLEAIRAVFG